MSPHVETVAVVEVAEVVVIDLALGKARVEDVVEHM